MRRPGRRRWSGSSRSRAGTRQPRAGHHRRGQGARHAGRDQRPAARRVGRAPRGRRPSERVSRGDDGSRRQAEGSGRWSRSRGRTFSRVHHVAVVVRDIEAALAFYRDTLGLPVELVLPIESDRVVIAFLTVGRVEGRARRADRHRHRRGALPGVEGRGLPPRLLRDARRGRHAGRPGRRGASSSSTAQARRGAEGPVAFLHPRSCHGVLVELIEAPGGPAWARWATRAPRLRRGERSRVGQVERRRVSRGGCRPPRGAAGSASATRRRGCRPPRGRRSWPRPCRPSR